MNINHISSSRYSVWDTCQLQYKFRYHLGIKTDEAEPVYFLYGSVVHKIAQEYVEAKGERLITEVSKDVLNGKIKLEGKKNWQLPDEYKRKLPEHLRQIEKLTAQTGFDGWTEYNFCYDLDPPHKRNVYGFIDRLIKKGDKLWILDYKTTKQGWFRKTQKDIVNDLQLRCYARVVQKTFKVPAQNIRAALYYLEGGELVGAQFSDATLENTEKELLRAYLDIQNTEADQARGRVGEWCRRCEYNKICPLYSLL